MLLDDYTVFLKYKEKLHTFVEINITFLTSEINIASLFSTIYISCFEPSQVRQGQQ